MFYCVEETGVQVISLEEISTQTVTAGYVTLEEFETVYERLGFSEAAVRECRVDQTSFRTDLELYDDFSFSIINIVDVQNVHAKRDRIALFLRKNLFVLVELLDEDGSTRRMFENAIGRYKQNITLEKVVYGVLEKLIAGGNGVIEKTERQIISMEKTLVEGKNITPNMNRDIFHLKNRLLIQKNYYEQLFDIGDALQENENNLFSAAELRYFKVFTNKAERLANNTQMLWDNLVHVREAYEASINYSMNKTMQLFTVLTAIFLPLTLIVGWYGMNFTTMPELTWRYGYLGVIVLSLIVVVVSLLWFKKKKLF